MFTEKEFSLLYDGLECMRTLTTYESYRKEHELLVEKLKQLENNLFDTVNYFYSVQSYNETGDFYALSGCIEYTIANPVHPNVLLERLYDRLNVDYPNQKWILIAFNRI